MGVHSERLADGRPAALLGQAKLAPTRKEASGPIVPGALALSTTGSLSQLGSLFIVSVGAEYP